MLKSKTYELEDPLAGQEYFHSRRWTDGLLVVPPTAKSAQEMLDRANLDPEHLMGIEPVRNRSMIAEKLAVNAVMAGTFRIISLWYTCPSPRC